MAFNNAGVMQDPGDPVDVPMEEYDRVMSINLRGVWLCMKHELLQMRAQGRGSIVNCSSMGGLVAQEGMAVYNGSKFGVSGVTRSASLSYAPHGVRINEVCPGQIKTPMIDDMMEKEKDAMEELARRQVIGRMGKPEEVAAAVL